MAVTGTVKFYEFGKLIEEQKFKAIYGHSEGKSGSRPFSVGRVVPNPGEPHIHDNEFFDVNCSVKNGLVGLFRRHYISQPAPSFVYSEMQMFPGVAMIGVPMVNDPCTVVHSALQPSLLSSGCASSGPVDSQVVNGKVLNIEITGEEEFQGIPANRLRVTYLESIHPNLVGMQIEMLVALAPTVLVLKFIDGRGGKRDEYRKQLCEELKSRELLEVKLWENRLIPVVTKFEAENRKTIVEVTDVSALPTDFHGLWEFDGPTGTRYSGNLESAIRKPGIHEPYARESSLIPFSLDEQEQIRQFLVGKKIIKPSGISWTRLTIYAINLIAIGYLVKFTWCRIRQNS